MYIADSQTIFMCRDSLMNCLSPPKQSGALPILILFQLLILVWSNQSKTSKFFTIKIYLVGVAVVMAISNIFGTGVAMRSSPGYFYAMHIEK